MFHSKLLKHTILAGIITCLSICVTLAQTIIKGNIKSNDKALEYVAVGLSGTGFGDMSDKNGHFEIKNVIPGKYIIQVSCVGYQLIKQTVEVKADQVINLSFNLVETSSQLNEVVITGTMKEVSKMESAVPIEVYSMKHFQKNPTPNLFESLNMVNGVRPQLQCNICSTGDIHINGMEGPYTMVMIDGMPIVSALSTVYGLMGIPNTMIERIEVQKGPASTLYGSEAVGGLINVITKNPYSSSRFSLDLYQTSYLETNADLGVSYSLGKKATGILSTNIYHFNKIYDINNDDFTDVTLQKRYSFFNKISFERPQARLANIAVRYMYEDRWGGQTNWTPQFRGSDSIYGESIYTKRFELIGNYQLPVPNEKFVFNYSFNMHDQNSVYGVTPFIALQKIGFGQLLWDKRIKARHNVLSGIALRYTWYDDNTPITRDPLEFNKNVPSVTILPGVFVQDEFTLTEKHTILGGMRYDYNSTHGNIFSPRLNYKYAITKNNVLRFSVGNGYRVVNLFSEDHAAFNGSRQVVITDKLKPEQSWNTNLNYTRSGAFEKGFYNIDASVFYTHFSNKIVPDYFSDPNKVIFSNLNGYGINKGVGINNEVAFTNSVKFMIGFTLSDVHQMVSDSTGSLQRKKQVQTPPFTSNYSISYTIPYVKILIDFSGSTTAPMLLPVLPNDYRASMSPWFHLLNIQLSKKFNNGLALYGGVKNLLNFIPKDPLMRPFDPFDKHAGDPVSNPNGYTFDAGYNYAPLQGIRVFLGLKYVIGK